MALELFNTLSGKIEEFHPLEDNLVRMYACGPTVYDYGHIGNFRTFVVVDTLRRFLKQSGFQLKHVMNVTDVDDKIIRNAAHDGLTVQEYTKKYRQAFLEDADALNIEHPEMIVSATDHIQDMAHFIAVLVEKGYAYQTDDGSYYFRIAKFPEYGKLSKRDFAGMEDGARVDVDEYDKDNARDFALWKAPKPGEAQWETEIGPGRPGWHAGDEYIGCKRGVADLPYTDGFFGRADTRATGRTGQVMQAPTRFSACSRASSAVQPPTSTSRKPTPAGR